MDTPTALTDLARAWCDQFAVHQVAPDRWAVQTPLLYDDGDGLPIFVSHETSGWQLTDQGMAFSHLYFDDFEYTEARLRALQRAVDGAGCSIDGEHRITLDLAGPPDVFDIGDFLQVVASVRGVAHSIHVDQERTYYVKAVRKSVMASVIADVVENWTPAELAPTKASYRADLKVARPHMPPVSLFIASTSERAKTAALTWEQFKRHHVLSDPILAYREGVSEEALNCFLDFTEDDDSIVSVDPSAPGRPAKLLRHLASVGVDVGETEVDLGL